MFIAHLPAGYLLTRGVLLLPGLRSLPTGSQRRLVVLGCLAAVTPDVDGLAWSWHHFLGLGAPHHHDYPTHWPLLWLALGLLALVPALLSQRRTPLFAVVVAELCLQLHMLLDSIAAPLHWFRPFGGGTLELVRVPTCPEASNVCHSLTAHWPCEAGHWVRDMLCHWTFLLELGIVLAAILLLASGWGRRRARAESG